MPKVAQSNLSSAGLRDINMAEHEKEFAFDNYSLWN